MDLPAVDGFDSILVVVDQGLTKGVILTPCNKTITVEETGKLLLENIYKQFGLPDKIIVKVNMARIAKSKRYSVKQLSVQTESSPVKGKP